MDVIEQAGVPTIGTEATWVENLRVTDLSLGTYTIPAGGADPQEPHTEDEVYVVTHGRGRLWTPGRSVDVAPGSVLFVAAGEEHRFVDVIEDLTVLVVFGPAEYTRATGPAPQ
jgi:mannose-6-phosphate isomerase-like protein (cupin superfamily)